MEYRASNVVSGDAVLRPQPAHLHEQQQQHDENENDQSDDSREATELRSITRIRTATRGALPPLSHVLSPGKPPRYWYDPIRRFWRHEVRLSVPHVDCRDHLANERTFLGYLRTSVAISVLGVTIAQLYRLQHSQDPSTVFGYYVMSKPLAVICQSAALGVVTLGGVRFWRQQSAMAVGRVHAGGWEVLSVAVVCFLLLLLFFAIHVGIDIYKE